MPKSSKPKKPAVKKTLGLGQKLAELRRGAGLTQETLASLIPVSLPALIKIENGQRLPSDTALARIATALTKAGGGKVSERKSLELELLTRKYVEHRTSDFLRRLALERLKTLE